MAVRVDTLDLGYECALQDLCAELRVHPPFEDAYACRTADADTSPHIDLGSMFWPAKKLTGLAPPMQTATQVAKLITVRCSLPSPVYLPWLVSRLLPLFVTGVALM